MNMAGECRDIKKKKEKKGVEGPGLCLAVLITPWLMSAPDEARVVLECEQALLTAFESAAEGVWLLGSIHLRPDGRWQAKLDGLKRRTQLTQTLALAAVLLAGDFNGQFHVERFALITFTKSAQGGADLGMEYVGKASMATHVRTRQGTKHETAIDHGFAGRAFGLDCKCELLPGVAGNMSKLKVQGVLRRHFGWKRYAWKKMEDRVKERLMAAVEIYWARLGDASP